MNNNNNKNVVYVAKLHWLLFFWPGVLAMITLYLSFEFSDFRIPILVFFAFSLIWLAMNWFIYYFSSLTVEKKRVIFRTGFLVRKTTDIPYSKIESMDIRQSLIGSIMGYGALMITGSGGTRHFINFLANPLTCRRYMEQLMNQAEGAD